MLTIDHPPIPFLSNIKYGLPDGGEIDLDGEAIYGAERAIWFEFKTMDGTALHINIRMGQSNQNTIVVNSYHKKWGHEEKHFSHVNPPGPLRMHIESHHKHYKIDINGGAFEFPHRLKAGEIKRLEITGDLKIHKLSFTNMDNHVELLGNYHQSHHHGH